MVSKRRRSGFKPVRGNPRGRTKPVSHGDVGTGGWGCLSVAVPAIVAIASAVILLLRLPV